MTTPHPILAGTATAADCRAWLDEEHRSTLAALLAPGARASRSYAGWGAGQPTGVGIHVAAVGGRLACDARGIARLFVRPGPGASSSAVTGPVGEVLLPYPWTRPAWHTGDPDGRGPAPDYNRTHLGLDLASPGPVELFGHAYYRPGTVERPGHEGRWWAPTPRHGWLAEVALAYPDGRLLQAGDVLDLPARPYGHLRWHLLLPAQVMATAALLRAWCRVIPTLDPGRIVRHSDVAPGARCDPGPSLPLEQVREWAASSCDLEAEIGERVRSGWARWIAEQWRAPTGLIVHGVDDVIPGRVLG